METNQTPETAVNVTEAETPANLLTGTESVPIAIGTAQVTENKEQNISEGVPLEQEPEKGSYKLTDEEFIAELELNMGLYAQTALSIERHYRIKYSRQAVYQRAKRLNRYQEEFKDIMIENAKEALFDAINQNTDSKLRLKAALFFLSKTAYGKYNDR